jgi:hypothetical protein
MKSYIGSCAIFALALGFSSPAEAAQVFVSLSGVLHGGDGPDAHLSDGTTVTLTTSFDSSRLITWGDSGYSIASVYHLPIAGPEFWRVDAGGLTWWTYDNALEGPFFNSDTDAGHFYYYLPFMVFQGNKVVGLMGDMAPSGGGRPDLLLGSGVPSGSFLYDLNGNHASRYADLVLSDQFSIGPDIYHNTYLTQGFTGTWDFAGATVTGIAAAVPEPATWAMFLIGFGAVGFTMRRGKRNGRALAPG